MKFKIKSIVLYLLILVISLSVVLFGCSSKKTGSGISKEDKIVVYASFYPMYDLTKKVGGDKIDLRTLMPLGSEPHDWEPGPRDIGNLQEASIFIYNGAGMEIWIEKIIGSLENKKVKIIETSKDIDLLENEQHHDEEEEKKGSHHHYQYDPHVWLNPQYAKMQLEVIKDALVDNDPDNKEYYEENFLNASIRMDELDREYKKRVSEFSRKDIVVTHGAFGYLCNAYGLRQVAIEAQSHDYEPSPGKMANVVKFIRDNDVKVIFHEELSNSKIAEAIARETGAEVMTLNTLGSISEQTIKEGGEYFSIMLKNLDALEKALK